MVITQEWLNEIVDEQGLTRGQVFLLNKWCKSTEHVGKEIPDIVANFLKVCKGYREIPQELKEFKSWV